MKIPSAKKAEKSGSLRPKSQNHEEFSEFSFSVSYVPDLELKKSTTWTHHGHRQK
jgi:hypothetical protein